MTKEDLGITLLAGASAGIGAIFKAPLTSIVFALEVPYKDDIAWKAFLPSIISGVASFMAFASVEGAQPLFSLARLNAGFNLFDIALSALLGLVVGMLSIGFPEAYHLIRNFFERNKIPFIARFVIGGL